MKGFSLFEVMVVTLILGIVIGGVFMTFTIGSRTYSRDIVLLDLEQQTRRALDSLMRELRQTDSFHVSISEGVPDSISFYILSDPNGTSGGAWVGPIRYYVDTVNSRLMRQEIDTTPRVVAHNIDDLQFVETGNFLNIEITGLQRVFGQDLTFVREGEVRMRN